MKEIKTSCWNLKKPGGWQAYKDLSDKAAEMMELIIKDETLPIDEVMEKIESFEKEIKFAAFGKTRLSGKKKKGKCESILEKEEDILRRQCQKIEDQINEIKGKKLGRVGSIFKIKEMINGPKKGSQDPTAVRHPITDDIIVSSEEIKSVTLDYCIQNLTNSPADPEVKSNSEIKEHLHNLRMELSDDDGFEILRDDFDSVLQKFSTKSTHSYDFLLKGGTKYKEVMFNFCKSMIEEEKFPLSFRKTLLNMIWKSKGPAEILKNNRFIHTKESFVPRLCEALATNKMKQRILDKSSKFQVGGQPGHSPEEHIFSIKSVWLMLESMSKGLIITLVNIMAFFDKENIYDVMQTLSDIGVNKKAARVWFKLNEGTEISVKTAGGISDTALVGDCIGQGTAGAALVSQVNLEQGLQQYFGDGGEDLQYGKIMLQPMAYQDDIMKGSKDVVTAQTGNIKLSAMLKDKGLDAHPDKTCFIVCGSKQFREKVERDLESNPLMFGTFPVKQKISDKYLGQVLHSGGVECSAQATVMERSGKIKGASMEIKSIVEEYQMQTCGGLIAAREPSLISGAGTWLGECKIAIDLCDQIQNFFWRVILKVNESCPKVALRCETGMLGMKWMVWQEKIFLLMRIRNHNEDTLCKQIYEEGKSKGWPGLSQEVRQICQNIDIPDVNEQYVPKHVVKKAVFDDHYQEMEKEVKKMKKLENIKNDDFRQVQDYFMDKSIEKARTAFKFRSQMLEMYQGTSKISLKRKKKN